VASTRSACCRSRFVTQPWQQLVGSPERLSFDVLPFRCARSVPVFGAISRSGASPSNKSLEPTPVSNAPSLSVGSGAAQLGRSASTIMIRSIFCALLLAIGLFDVANACSCIRESEDKRTAIAGRLESAQLVFLGRIEETETFKLMRDDDLEVEYQRTRFYILESWKGEKAARVYIQSPITCCLCGYKFPKSGVFLVFAYGPDKNGYYEATSCVRPLKRGEAKDDIAVLNELVAKGRTSR